MGMRIKNVCIDCGKSGFFLKLDGSGRCADCARAAEKYLTMEEVTDEAAKMIRGEGDARPVLQHLREQEAKHRRTREKFFSVYDRYAAARKLEKEGAPEKALEIYLQLLPDCPGGTDYYVRPCILLEKAGDYGKAIEICNLAIAQIRQGRFQADPEEFLRRRERLERKQSKKTDNP